MIENVNVDLLNKTYQNANLGITAIRAVLGKVSNEQMDSDLHKQLQDYRSLASRTKRQLQDNGECPKNISTYKRAMMKGNVRMNTMISRSDSHIAQMVIQGSTMGVTQMMRLIRSSENANQACKQIAEEFVKKEESNIEKMKTYL